MTMDMEFQIGRSVTFGFDVGGSYVPPEPGGNVPVLNGTIRITLSGNLLEITEMDVISGTAETEE